MSVGNTAFTWPIDVEGVSDVIGPAFEINSVAKYRWMVIVGGILAFFMAWGIGANDVANAFATSVGAGSLTLPVACAIAAVMEFAGALLLGGSVTDTVRKKVINIEDFDPNRGGAANGPEMLMTGFLVALFSATTWLVVATFFALPVSTTHSIIGSLIGVGLAYGGGGTVSWWPDGSGLSRLKGVIGVIISWIVSPVLSGIIAVIMFLIVRTTVLRRADPFKAGLMFMPLFYGFTLAIAVFFIVFKGDKRFDLSEKLGTGGAVGVALGAGAVLAVFTWFVITPLAKKSVARWEEREAEKEKNPDAYKEKEDRQKAVTDALGKVGVNLEINQELDEDVVRMHDNVEKFDPKTERLFTWVQVFTAAVDAFAHGANDVANSIAPFSSIFQLNRGRGVLSGPKSSKFGSDDIPSGTDFEEGDRIPNGSAFCGESEVEGEDEKFYQCQSADSVQFPFLDGPKQGAPSKDFTLFSEDDDSGDFVADSSQTTCYTDCNPRQFTKYDKVKQDVPLWILALGGIGIVVGLAMWGYRIIQAIGVKLTKLTPARGFAIEIGAAITVLIASEIGIPVSTTHCQVGATMGVGLVEGKASTVNWKQFFFICVGWVFTVVFTGFISAMMYLVITYSPLRFDEDQGELGTDGDNLDYCPGQNLFAYDPSLNQFRGLACSGNEE